MARQPYDLALNLGVCGTFDRALGLGTVVHVVSDCLAELGAEDGDRFLTIQDLGLLDPDEFPFRAGRLVNDHPPANPALSVLPAVGGITVNTVHGNERFDRSGDRAFPSAGREHGGGGVHVRLHDQQRAVRAGARGVQRGRAAKPRGLGNELTPSATSA